MDKGIELPSWLNIEAWEGFVEMRKSIKRPMTMYAMKLAIRKLEQFKDAGIDPTMVMEQSIFHCWQGLFTLKDDGIPEPIKQIKGEEVPW